MKKDHASRAATLNTFAIVVLVLARCTAAMAQDAEPSSAPKNLVLRPSHAGKIIRANDPLKVGDAIRRGDIEALDSVLSKSIKPAAVAEIYRWYALAGKERIHGDLAASSAHAESCLKSSSGLSERNHNFLIFAVSCGELLAGNHLLQGDFSGWAATLQRIARENRAAMDAFEKTQGITDAQVLAVPGIDLDAYARLPAVSVRASGQAVSVLPRVVKPGSDPWVSARELRVLPYVRIAINGVDTVALLDTGTSQSVVPASSLGVFKMQNKGLKFFDLDIHEAGVARADTRLVIADHLQVGDVAVQHAPFVVAELGPLIIGLDLLRRLTPFLLFSGEDVRLYASPPPQTCPLDLRIQSELLGLTTIAIRADRRTPIGLRPTQLFLDTGMGAQSVAAAKAHLTPRDGLSTSRVRTGLGYQIVPVGHDRLTLQIDGRPMELDTHIRPTLNLPNAYGLGALMLRDFDLGLDFAHHRACLTPRKRWKPPLLKMDAPSQLH